MRGFTLIELMIVVAIFGIIAAIVSSAIQGSKPTQLTCKDADGSKILDVRVKTWYVDEGGIKYYLEGTSKYSFLSAPYIACTAKAVESGY